MAYNLLHLPDVVSYRQTFIDVYCDHAKPIITFDQIRVKFYPNMFEHAFYESVNRAKGDKSQFSYTRAQRILWIKETLEDPTSDLRVGWEKSKKTYDRSRRVAIVQGNYVVIIWIQNPALASFITAYEADNSIRKILQSPVWTGL